MSVRVIEEAALYTPDLVVHLPPLGARRDIHLHGVELQRATFAGLRWALGRFLGLSDEPLILLPVEHLLAVKRQVKGVDALDELLRLARLQVKLV